MEINNIKSVHLADEMAPDEEVEQQGATGHLSGSGEASAARPKKSRRGQPALERSKVKSMEGRKLDQAAASATATALGENFLIEQKMFWDELERIHSGIRQEDLSVHVKREHVPR